MYDYSRDIRRKDRQKTDTAFIKDLLYNSVSCSIAVEKEGFPLIHVAFFSYDENANEIIFHFSKHGHAGNVITDGKKACVSVYKCGRLYTAHQAVDFGCEYQSAIIYGTIKIVEDETERMKAMDMFFKKFFNSVSKDNYDPFTSVQAKPIHVAKIKIDEWFGKEHRAPETALQSFYHPADPRM